MCSSLSQVAFGVIMLGAIALTLGSTFSNKWRKIATIASDIPEIVESAQKNPDKLQGILPFFCETETTKCSTFWENMKPYEKIVATCMILALILEIVAFIWNFVTSCSCCLKKYLIHPLSPLSFFIAILLSIGIGLFYLNNEDIKNDPNIVKLLNADVNDLHINVGSAFWMAIGAWVLVVADTIIASLAIFFAERGV